MPSPRPDDYYPDPHRPKSPEHRAKMSAAQLGKKKTQATKDKIRASVKAQLKARSEAGFEWKAA